MSRLRPDPNSELRASAFENPLPELYVLLIEGNERKIALTVLVAVLLAAAIGIYAADFWVAVIVLVAEFVLLCALALAFLALMNWVR